MATNRVLGTGPPSPPLALERGRLPHRPVSQQLPPRHQRPLAQTCRICKASTQQRQKSRSRGWCEAMHRTLERLAHRVCMIERGLALRARAAVRVARRTGLVQASRLQTLLLLVQRRSSRPTQTAAFISPSESHPERRLGIAFIEREPSEDGDVEHRPSLIERRTVSAAAPDAAPSTVGLAPTAAASPIAHASSQVQEQGETSSRRQVRRRWRMIYLVDQLRRLRQHVKPHLLLLRHHQNHHYHQRQHYLHKQ